mgnify:CR=1 FL=1
MSRDILDAFDRRHGKQQFEAGDFPKLEYDQKIMFIKALTKKINALQKQLEISPNDQNIILSQMMLMWTYDQVKFGKM